MAESHPELGLSKQDFYRMSKHEVNQEFDKKLANKSFFDSKKSIEADREKALKGVHDQYWGGGGGGGFCD
jgi:hypothetical protein